MIDEVVAYTIFHLFLNTIGGTIRWIYGSIWRTIFKKPKFDYKEYLYGPKKSKNHWDKHHVFNNGLVAVIFLIIIGWILL